MYDKRECGNRLRQLREAKGKTQQDVASEVGLSIDTLCKVEQGKRSPSVVVVDLLSGYYQTTADYIISGCIYSVEETKEMSKSILEQKCDLVEQLIDDIRELIT
ncbi:MAG: helix-turn-helix domain-containing protein [Clostridium sp.]|nr:helix-turn-helix domain-containing protein [Clostridium sp.]MCM1208327.1 helix-turn-helix domain-containing protein [Ruminococcus sp.]